VDDRRVRAGAGEPFDVLRSTADRIGRRKTFQAGLAVFTVGSLLCSLAPGLGWLSPSG
jgi:hypothetical protein